MKYTFFTKILTIEKLMNSYQGLHMKINSVLCYLKLRLYKMFSITVFLELKRFKSFAFIVIQNQNVIQVLQLMR